MNLYTNPQEDMSLGVRHLPLVISLGQEANRYGKVLAKYPPVVKVVMPGKAKWRIRPNDRRSRRAKEREGGHTPTPSATAC